jgi:hypothetical protein
MGHNKVFTVKPEGTTITAYDMKVGQICKDKHGAYVIKTNADCCVYFQSGNAYSVQGFEERELTVVPAGTQIIIEVT